MTPTVGRRVWYWPTVSDLWEYAPLYKESGQPWDAGILFVHPGGDSINALVTEYDGTQRTLMGVELVDDSSMVPGACCWMPYQTKQVGS